MEYSRSLQGKHTECKQNTLWKMSMGRGEQEEAREPRSVGGLAWEWA